jgi:hypothetical protein
LRQRKSLWKICETPPIFVLNRDGAVLRRRAMPFSGSRPISGVVRSPDPKVTLLLAGMSLF